MQGFVEWHNFKFRSGLDRGIGVGVDKGSGVVPKTGFISLMMIPIFLGLLTLTALAVNGFGSDQDFNIFRVFVSVLIFFVFVPIFVILRNENISGNAKKQFFESDFFQGCNKMLKIFARNNKVFSEA